MEKKKRVEKCPEKTRSKRDLWRRSLKELRKHKREIIGALF